MAWGTGGPGGPIPPITTDSYVKSVDTSKMTDSQRRQHEKEEKKAAKEEKKAAEERSDSRFDEREAFRKM